MKLLAVGLYAAVLILIGYLASKRVKNIRDYFASGKSLGFFNVAFSARATGESAWLLLGLRNGLRRGRSGLLGGAR